MGDEEAIYFLNAVFKGLFLPQLDMDGPPPQIKWKVSHLSSIRWGCKHTMKSWHERDLGRQENWTCSYLYGHHEQHLHGDPVKLVKAAPRHRLSQAFVDAPTGLVDTERQRHSDWHSGTGSRSVRLADGDLVRLSDKACGKADRDVSPISQKIYGRNILCSKTAAWESGNNNRMIQNRALMAKQERLTCLPPTI